MPRKLSENMTLETIEEEILFTQAALAADPDAESLLPLTVNWLSSLEAQITRDREARRRIVNVDATRSVANARLDQTCTDFADALYFDVKKDRTAPRWTQFFNLPVSHFVRVSLPKQVVQVRSWLNSQDPLLVEHKPDLERWATKADEALVNTRSLALVRGELTISRMQFCDDLTHDRDGLHAALMQKARELGLTRDWPNTFFRVTRRLLGAEDFEEPANDAAPPPAA